MLIGLVLKDTQKEWIDNNEKATLKLSAQGCF
ncbi:hypothetical protein SMKC069_08370 [Serratia marcescens]|nr:hypothetical protein SMKC069_08370 [Serratia marcescens]